MLTGLARRISPARDTGVGPKPMAIAIRPVGDLAGLHDVAGIRFARGEDADPEVDFLTPGLHGPLERKGSENSLRRRRGERFGLQPHAAEIECNQRHRVLRILPAVLAADRAGRKRTCFSIARC